MITLFSPPLLLLYYIVRSLILIVFSFFGIFLRKPCWFLVQIDHAENTLLNLDSKHTGDYHVTFSAATQMTVIFVTILLAGGLFSTSIKTLKIMSLSMVLGCYLVQNVNQILPNASFVQTLFTSLNLLVIRMANLNLIHIPM